MSFSSFAQYYLWGFIILIGLWAVGQGILQLLRISMPNRTTHAFASMALGLTLAVTGTALAFTYGKTIFWGAGILLVLMILEYKRTRQSLGAAEAYRPEGKAMLRTLLEIFGVYTVTFLLLGKEYLVPSINAFYESNSDTAMYANFADGVRLSGYESTNQVAGLFNPDFKGTNPYHFFDLYVALFLSLMTGGGKLIFCYGLIGNAICAVISFMGCLAIINHYRRQTGIADYLIAFGFQTMTAFILPLYYTQSSSLENFLIGSFDHPLRANINLMRSSVPDIYITVAFLLWVNSRRYAGALALMFLPLVNIVNAPGVMSGLFGFAALSWLLKQDRPTAVKTGLTVLGLFGFIAVFYKTTGAAGHLHNGMIMEINGMAFVKGYALYIAKYILRTLVLYAPLVVLLMYLMYSNKMTGLKAFWATPSRQWLVLNVLILIAALLVGSLLYQNFDGIQIYTTLALTSLYNMALVGLCIYRERKNRFIVDRLYKAIYIAFLATGFASVLLYNVFNAYFDTRNFVYPYDTTFVSKIGAILNEDKRELIMIGTMSEQFSRYPLLAEALSNVRNGVSIHYIDYDKTINKEPELTKIDFRKVRASSMFMTFCEDLRKENQFVDYTDAKIKFIDRHGIKYLVMTDGTIVPDEIRQRIALEITDTATKQMFIKLK